MFSFSLSFNAIVENVEFKILFYSKPYIEGILLMNSCHQHFRNYNIRYLDPKPGQ